MTPDGKMKIDVSKVTRIPEELEKTADHKQRALFAILLEGWGMCGGHVPGVLVREGVREVRWLFFFWRSLKARCFLFPADTGIGACASVSDSWAIEACCSMRGFSGAH